MELPNDEIHLYFANPGQITDADVLRQYRSLLSDDERMQMSRFHFDRHRHQYLVTRALIRTCLSNYYNIGAADWVFGKNGFDKPEIALPLMTQPIRFNLSHADGLIMCGLAREFDIGVDVENCQRSTRAAFSRLASYFSEQEIEDLAKLPEVEQKQRFFDYWTLKESYIKARGAGFSIPLKKFSFQFEKNRLANFSIHADLDDDAGNWQFWRVAMAEHYRLAVAVNSGKTAFTIRAVNTVPLNSTEPIALNFL
jgi:4'-phosphopantetheinyl transferase